MSGRLPSTYTFDFQQWKRYIPLRYCCRLVWHGSFRPVGHASSPVSLPSDCFWWRLRAYACCANSQHTKRRDPRGGSLTEGRPANSSAGVHARRFGRPACAQSTISRAESCPGQPAITVSALHTRRFSLLPNVLTVLQAGFLLRERKLGIVKLQRTALISTRSRRGCPVVQIVCLCVTWCACVLLASAPEAITGGRAMPPQVNMYRNERNNAWPGCVEDTRFLSMSQKFVCLTACTRAITSSPSEDSLSLSFFLCLSLSLSPPSSPCLYPCLCLSVCAYTGIRVAYVPRIRQKIRD